MFVDLHHHILFGLDDGAGSEDQMQRMLAAAAADGTRHLAATPHISLDTCPFPVKEYVARFRQAQAWCRANNLGIALHTGAEILYSDGIVNLLQNGEIPTLGRTNFVLVEFLPDISEKDFEGAIRRLSNSGFQVVAAHVERYGCMYDLERAKRLRELYPVKYQVNASTAAVGGQGLKQKLWLKKMLHGGLVDVVASDSHSTGQRRTRMTEAYTRLCEMAGSRAAQQMCCLTPLQILGIPLKSDS